MPLTPEIISPQLKRWHQNHYAWLNIAVPALLFVFLICVIEIIAREEQWRERNEEEQLVIRSTNEIRTLLEYELNSALHLTTGLVSYIQSKHGVLIAEEIDPWLSNLQERGNHVRNIAIAPNNKIAHLYPLKGNEGAMGLYYPDDKVQWPDVKKTILSHKPMLAGPLELRQGGQGLLYRVPVYLDNVGYWGLISTVLNSDKLFALITKRAEQLGIKVAIQDVRAGANKQKLLFGDNSILDTHSYAEPLSIPGRDWQLIAELVTQKSNYLFTSSRVISWMTALALALLLYYFLRSLAQRHLIAHAVDESKYGFSHVFNISPQGIAIINQQGDWLDLNKSLCTTLGYTREELLALNFYNLLTVEQQLYISRVMDTDNFQPINNNQYETTLLHHNGDYINVILSFAPLYFDQTEFDSPGKRSDWVVQIIDISHRVTVEKLLQEEADYNQAILNSVVDGIITIDKRAIIRSANPATETIFACKKEHISNKNISNLFQEPYASIIAQHIKHPKNDKDINAEINKEIIGLKGDGTAFPLEIHCSYVYRKNEKLLIAVVRDLSEKKRLDQEKNEVNK